MLTGGNKCMRTGRRPWSENLSHSHTEIWMHMHCTHKHTFIYVYACNRYAYVWWMLYTHTHTDKHTHTHTLRTEMVPSVPSGPNCSESVWSCLTVSADRRLSEVKHAHLPQNPNVIDTDHIKAKWKLNWTEINRIDSDWRGTTRFTQPPLQDDKIKEFVQSRYFNSFLFRVPVGWREYPSMHWVEGNGWHTERRLRPHSHVWVWVWVLLTLLWGNLRQCDVNQTENHFVSEARLTHCEAPVIKSLKTKQYIHYTFITE